MQINIKKLNPKAILPKTATKGSACFDLYSCEEFSLFNGYFHMVRTGIAMEIPDGHHVEIYIRSSLAKRGIIIPNATAIIDSDFRGEVVVLLYGLFMKDHEVFPVGARIAQGRLVKNIDTEFVLTNVLSDTARGVGGLGSTGR